MAELFSPDALSKSVHDSLDEAYQAIPDGKSHALLIDATTDKQVRVLFVQRVGDGWDTSLAGQWDGKHVTGKVAVMRSW